MPTYINSTNCGEDTEFFFYLNLVAGGWRMPIDMLKIADAIMPVSLCFWFFK